MKLEEFGPRSRLAYQRVRAIIERKLPCHVSFSDSYWHEFRTRCLSERSFAPKTLFYVPSDTSLMNQGNLHCTNCPQS